MLGVPLTSRHVTAIVLALGGVALPVGGGSVQNALSKVPDVLCGLTTARLFGRGTVVAKKRPLAIASVAGVASQALFDAITVTARALFAHPDWSRLNTIGVAIFGSTAVMQLTAGHFAWLRALRYVPVSLPATTVLLSSTIGVIVSTLVLGEPLGPRQVVALGLTLTGVAMAAIREVRDRTRQRLVRPSPSRPVQARP